MRNLILLCLIGVPLGGCVTHRALCSGVLQPINTSAPVAAEPRAPGSAGAQP